MYATDNVTPSLITKKRERVYIDIVDFLAREFG
jgi:hypothetical protein